MTYHHDSIVWSQTFLDNADASDAEDVSDELCDVTDDDTGAICQLKENDLEHSLNQA